MRNSTPLGPYSRTLSRVLGVPRGVGISYGRGAWWPCWLGPMVVLEGVAVSYRQGTPACSMRTTAAGSTPHTPDMYAPLQRLSVSRARQWLQRHPTLRSTKLPWTMYAEAWVRAGADTHISIPIFVFGTRRIRPCMDVEKHLQIENAEPESSTLTPNFQKAGLRKCS